MTGAAVLLLAGTGEARRLATLLAAMPGVAATASLSGATAAPASYAVPVRSGGFGGVAGLTAHLRRHRVAALIDATHPFAVGIGRNAAAAAAAAGVPLLRLERPPWPTEPAWRVFADAGAAMAALPAGARIFLATGGQRLSAMATRSDVACVARVIEVPPDVPPHVRLIVARPPFSVAQEAELMRAHAITHLLARNSGGAEGRAKLDAASALGVTVMMIGRPRARPGGTVVATPEAAAHWVRAKITVESVRHA